MFESVSTEAVHGDRGDRQHDNPRLTHRFATSNDLMRFYGEARPETIQAVIVHADDEPVAVIGLVLRKQCALLFADYTPLAYELRHSMAILRAIKKAMTLVQKSKRPVYSVRQEGTDLLVRLGFIQVSEDVYKWLS